MYSVSSKFQIAFRRSCWLLRKASETEFIQTHHRTGRCTGPKAPAQYCSHACKHQWLAATQKKSREAVVRIDRKAELGEKKGRNEREAQAAATRAAALAGSAGMYPRNTGTAQHLTQKEAKRVSSSSSDSSDDDSGSPQRMHHPKKKTKKHDEKKNKKKKKQKVKKKTQLKEKTGKVKCKLAEDVPGPSISQWQKEVQVDSGPVLTDEQKSRVQAMKPMTKEEYEAKQSVIRRVIDPETGRTRLIKGDGEVLEEIVSQERHKEINKQATKGDGLTFQMRTGMLQ
ncbi:hypothetical protein NDU88_006343 [Pleurodeles waltl]|uniref:ADP-ribosylation factor-like protein 6-interacting protein 4 n=1 Tax=Pleurodeles waltl TaxID=8319 RepID=A0AAV7LWN4_PLEWA|nr:hypothetical protein NDU88_006343 [Pleurodeles waltl]